MTFFKKTALAAAVAGLMLGAGTAQAQVSYNNTSTTTGDGPGSPADSTSAGPWTGGSQGYVGDLPASWIAVIQNAGGVANAQTASTADALANGANSAYVLGMGAKAYKDGATNWGHTADFGLFQLQHAAQVTISVSPDNNTTLRPAFGLWSGWDSAGSGASRHSAYLSNGAILSMAAGVLGSTLTLVDASAWAVAPGAGGTATLTRFLTAGNYSLVLGGYDSSGGSNVKYTATISAAAVPVPAAAWLFGGALASLIGAHRRKRVVPL